LLIGEVPAGAIVSFHSHSDRETFYVLSGEMNFYRIPERSPDEQELVPIDLYSLSFLVPGPDYASRRK
jgi:hypothetical protein